jgi:bleomycin hydrolase
MNITLTILALTMGALGYAQNLTPAHFQTITVIPHTPVKNQAQTGTCWSFSTTSLIESLSASDGSLPDISEMYTVRNIYIEKARNYVLRQGVAQFGEGGLGHDVIRAIDCYGAMPEQAYGGLLASMDRHDHSALERRLKAFLDSLLTHRPLPAQWLNEYSAILDSYLGKVPDTFMYQDRPYTPQAFARDVLKFNASDYVNITSFTHHPYYAPFVLEVPDNFSNGAYYNLPIEEMLEVVEVALKKGYSVMWDADVSNVNFRQREGLAMESAVSDKSRPLNPEAKEILYDAKLRQELFENLTTQDDHLMHLVGLEVDDNGKRFYLVKNSWGTDAGPYAGYIHVSKAYLAINTISLVVPKAALDSNLLSKLRL